MRTPTLLLTLLLTLALALYGCGKDDGGDKHDHDHDHAGHNHDHDHDHAADKPAAHHAHTAPNGGALVPVGPAHLEFKLDPETGKVTVWVLDGEAKGGVKIDQSSFKVAARIVDKDGADAGKPAVELMFAPEVSGLTGNTAESSSIFTATSDDLKGAAAFEGTIDSITVKGTEHKGVAVSYPKGNE